MRAVQVTCPQCGAALRVGDAASAVTCEYCGGEARVQRRSRVLERVMPPPPGPQQIATQRRSGAPVVFGVITLAVVGVVTLVTIKAVQEGVRNARIPSGGGAGGAGGGGGATPTPPEERFSWEGTGGVIVHDVDGDGVVDVIGRRRWQGGEDLISVTAIDGETGAELWRSEPLGTYTDTYQGTLALAGDTVLFASTRAQVSAFAVADGKPRWSVTLPERVAQFCGLEGGVVIAVGTDQVRRPLALADGAQPEIPKTAGKPKKPAPCPTLPHDRDDGDPTSLRSDGDYELAKQLGWWGIKLVRRPDGARVGMGQRSTGTHVPQLAGLEPKGRTVRWTVDIPTDPLGAQEREPDLLTIGAEQVCASWTPNEGRTPHLSCFALADGARRWDVELMDDDPLEALVMTPTLILVSMWGYLEARDPATGTLIWRYGTS